MPFTDIEKDILQTLMYYDIFSYPLTLEEIAMCSQLKEGNLALIAENLGHLLEKGDVFEEGNFYALQKSPEWVRKRIENNARAQKILPTAKRISQFIGYFPYVRAVFLSGSISKNVFLEDGDIDYFILTKPKRLWLARTLLILFRKIFLFNSHKYFCVNYFLDIDNIELEDKNHFTATELSTLIPTFGREYYMPLMEQNNWYRGFFPHFPLRNTENVPTNRKSLLKTCLEFVFDTPLGDWLDEGCMKITMYYRKKKFGHIPNIDFDIALKGRKYVSKHHPNHFQKKVETALAERKKKYSL